MIRALPLALALATQCPAQEEPTTRPARQPVDQAYSTLAEELDRRADRSQRVVLLREFLAAYADSAPAAEPVLTARCRLGSELLTAFAPADARAAFEPVLADAAGDQIDFRGRALYGIAQAHELAGARRLAREALERTAAEARGTRYARFAELALDRLRRARAVAVGATAPEFGPCLDIDGKPRQLAALAGGPTVLVFGRLGDEPSLDALRELVAATTRAELDADRLVLFVTDLTAAEARRLAASEKWTMPIVECSAEFVDRAAMTYAVRSLPSTFLVGPDGTLLAKDPTPARAQEILQALR